MGNREGRERPNDLESVAHELHGTDMLDDAAVQEPDALQVKGELKKLVQHGGRPSNLASPQGAMPRGNRGCTDSIVRTQVENERSDE